MRRDVVSSRKLATTALFKSSHTEADELLWSSHDRKMVRVARTTLRWREHPMEAYGGRGCKAADVCCEGRRHSRSWLPRRSEGQLAILFSYHHGDAV